MLRLLIGTGLLLMALGFGAAGWQYWQGLPAETATQEADPAAVPVAAPQQTWLVTATGGLVPRETVLAYVTQDRFVPGRIATIVRTAPLTDLLTEGETLPAAPYLQVFADIRAPALAEDLCPVLRSLLAEDCAVHSARVVDGSVDAVRGTARFQVELAYTLKPDVADLPDPAAHVFVTRTIDLGGPAVTDEAATEEQDAATEEPAPAAPIPDTPAAALTTLVDAALAACADPEAGQACRVLGLSLDWEPGSPARGQARVSWLSPLPEGMFPAPSLDPAPEG
ncbi:hypothetical protein EI545_16465 [Tabrizicola piscis]|uniref:Uncharacterized protein n=1 Tax=Tabrizicola piscis TaxID=2494374 RepID=A0A3S8U9J8_9RHOB|nr:hypothetical protein [Tabrizicola piscis]AZL60277.1 hypothetical protein EI545_16465 [Tabrizicola piscis]